MRAGTREVWWDCVQSIPCHTWGKLCTRGLSHSAVPLSQLRLAGLAQSINQLTNPELHLKGWDLMGEKAASRLITPFNLIPWTSRNQRRWEKETPKFPKWFIYQFLTVLHGGAPGGLQPTAQTRVCFHSSQLGNSPKPSSCFLSLQKCLSCQPLLAPLAPQAQGSTAFTTRVRNLPSQTALKAPRCEQLHSSTSALPLGEHCPLAALLELYFLQLSLKLAQQNVSIWAWQQRRLQVSSVSGFT